MKTRARALVAAILLPASVLPGVAHAEPASPSAHTSATAPDESRARFARGLEMYQDGDYGGALAEFRKAYALSHNSRILYNVGQVCVQVQDYVCAQKALEQYLADTKDVAAKRREEVQEDLSKLEGRIGAVAVTTNVEGTEIFVDDESVGRTPLGGSIPVNVGRRRISASKEGYARVVRLVDVAGGERVEVDLTLASIVRAPEAVAPPPPVADVPREPVPSERGMTTASWVGVAGSGALAIGSGVCGVLALSASSDLNRAPYVGQTVPPQADADQSRVRGFALAADVLGGVAVVTLATVLVLTYVVKPASAGRVSAIASGALAF